MFSSKWKDWYETLKQDPKISEVKHNLGYPWKYKMYKVAAVTARKYLKKNKIQLLFHSPSNLMVRIESEEWKRFRFSNVFNYFKQYKASFIFFYKMISYHPTLRFCVSWHMHLYVMRVVYSILSFTRGNQPPNTYT